MASPSVQVIVLKNNVPAVTPKMRAGAAAALNAGLMATIGYADPLTPVGPTGFLKGHKAIQVASPGSLTASVTWVMFYAGYQNWGTSRGVPAKHFADGGAARAQPGLIAGLRAVGGQLA